ncbi:MAG: retroviral-like aspartic protease family protein [Candidatus Tectomicrobia bacterium]|nr:retroviral-like aspartic protease family protein [Candidatus Tectomicrobia bacterium]
MRRNSRRLPRARPLLALGLGLLLGGLGVTSSSAEIYKWVDPDGGVHFSNTAPPSRGQRGVEVRREAPSDPAGSVPALPARRSAGNVTLSFEREGGAIVIPAVVNDRHPARFIIDTGATYTVISTEFARRLRQETPGEPRRVILQTASGSIEAPLIQLASIRIRDAEVRQVPTAVHTINAGGNITGVLGLSFLSAFRVTIDHETGSLSLEPRP